MSTKHHKNDKNGKDRKHHKGHSKTYKEGKRKHKIDYYNLPDRNDYLEEHYASIHGSYSTVEQLNELITQFYKPNCSVHWNVPKESLQKFPGMSDIQAYPGKSRCFGDISENATQITD
jgi:hypothetical protein